jgi:transposase
MKSNGYAQELERRRLLAIRRLKEGRSAVEVAQFLEVHERTVRDWFCRFERGGESALACKPHPGPKSKLNAQQAQEVLNWLEKSPLEFGFSTECWTAPRVARLVLERLGVRYHPRSLNRWLREHDVTPQKPRRQPRERDPAAIDRWMNEQWPLLSKKAAELGAHIAMIDEAGAMMAPLLRRSQARRGRTPVIKQRGRHRLKVSMQAAVVMNSLGQAQSLKFQTYPNSYVNSEKTALFLRKLLEEVPGELIVVWDRGNMHKGPAVRQVLAEFPRLQTEFLPAYAPDLDPVEWLWSWIKYGKLANFAPMELDELHSRLLELLEQAAASPPLLQGFIRASELPEPARRIAA